MKFHSHMEDTESRVNLGEYMKVFRAHLVEVYKRWGCVLLKRERAVVVVVVVRSQSVDLVCDPEPTGRRDWKTCSRGAGLT